MTEYERSAWSAITSGGHRGDGDEHAHQCIDRPAVWDRTPAVPASTATTADHLSGRQMNPVKGRGPVTSDRSIQPTARAIRASTAVIAIATTKPLDQEACRVLDEVRSSGRQAHRQGGDHTELGAHDHPADHENGGVRNHGHRNHGHRGNGGGQRQERIERPRPARFAIGMVHHGVHTIASSGAPGAARSVARALEDGAAATSVTTTDPSSYRPWARSQPKTSDAASRVTSHCTRSPAGRTPDPWITNTFVVRESPSRCRTTASVRPGAQSGEAQHHRIIVTSSRSRLTVLTTSPAAWLRAAGSKRGSTLRAAERPARQRDDHVHAETRGVDDQEDKIGVDRNAGRGCVPGLTPEDETLRTGYAFRSDVTRPRAAMPQTTRSPALW